MLMSIPPRTYLSKMNSPLRLVLLACSLSAVLVTSVSANPASIDTDFDSLDDLAETNTRIQVVSTNTGTKGQPRNLQIVSDRFENERSA